MMTRIMTVALVVLGLQAGPPGVGQIQTWYEAGEYQQIVDQGGQTADPKAQYLLASSYEKLNRVAEARGVYERLATRAEGDPWALVGRSANALLTDGGAPMPQNVEEAFLAAQQAVAAVTPSAETSAPAVTGPGAAAAYYQLGLVQAQRNDYAGSAASFEKAASLDPAFAYAYYYGGLANSRVDRPDQMAINFERFLQLAPNAPETERVQALMRSVRGR